MDGYQRLGRWLLILEGLPAIVCGVVTYFLLPSRPVEANFLAEDEKEWIMAELRREEEQKSSKHGLSAWRALAHAKVWHLASIHFAFDIGFYGMTFYLPQGVRLLSNGYSNMSVGLLVMIPHLTGLTSMILVSRSSDRREERIYHASIPLVIGGSGLVLLGTTTSLWVSIILWSFAAMGIYGYLGPFWSLPSGFLTGFAAASGIALINSVGNLGGFVGPYAIGAVANGAGGIYRGLAVAGVSLFMSAMLVMLLPKKEHGLRH